MRDPRELYELSGAPVYGAPALVALSGFMDAGQSAILAAQHLIDTHRSRIIARFDVDQLVVAEAYVGKSITMKRFATRGRGKSTRILKPFSRLRIVVREQEEA